MSTLSAHNMVKTSPTKELIKSSETSGEQQSSDQSLLLNHSATQTAFNFNSIPIQPKLTINAPGDKYEREADQIADQIVQKPINYLSQQEKSKSDNSTAAQIKPLSSSMAHSDNKGGNLNMDGKDFRQSTASSLSSRLNQSKGCGQAMDHKTNSFMSTQFGTDFSRIRIHTDSSAVQANEEINAHAFTLGNNIYFNRDKYKPGSRAGKKLLAHELVHTVQQKGLNNSNNSHIIQRQAKPPIQSLGKRFWTIDEAVLHALTKNNHTEVQRLIQGSSKQKAQHLLNRFNKKDAFGVYFRQTGNIPTDKKAAILAKAKEKVNPGPPKFLFTLPNGSKMVMTKEEYEVKAKKAIEIALRGLEREADAGRDNQNNFLSEYHGEVESFGDIWDKPKALIGIASDIWSGNRPPPPIDSWSFHKKKVQAAREALKLGKIGEAATLLRQAQGDVDAARKNYGDYLSKTIEGGEKLTEDLEVVRDTSFAIALVAGAAVAAPVVAGVAATAGLAGAGATAATMAGTALVVGAGGATLRGGSAAAGTYFADGKVNRKEFEKEYWRGWKEGGLTGATAGMTPAVGSAAGVGKAGLSVGQKMLRNAASEAIVSGTGGALNATVDEFSKDQKGRDFTNVLKKGGKGVATGAISGVTKGLIGGKKGAEATVDALLGGGEALLSGGSGKDIAAAMVSSTLQGLADAPHSQIRKGEADVSTSKSSTSDSNQTKTGRADATPSKTTSSDAGKAVKPKLETRPAKPESSTSDRAKSSKPDTKKTKQAAPDNGKSKATRPRTAMPKPKKKGNGQTTKPKPDATSPKPRKSGSEQVMNSRGDSTTPKANAKTSNDGNKKKYTSLAGELNEYRKNLEARLHDVPSGSKEAEIIRAKIEDINHTQSQLARTDISAGKRRVILDGARNLKGHLDAEYGIDLTQERVWSHDPLPETSVVRGGDMQDSVETNVIYSDMIAQSPDREVAIYRNPETGEHIIVQGNEGTVITEKKGAWATPAPGGIEQSWKKGILISSQGRNSDVGRWELVAHYHPVDSRTDAVRTVNRLPSGEGGDFRVLMGESYNAGGTNRSSRIDFYDTVGNKDFTLFSYDPKSERPFKVDYPEPVSGKRTKESFGSLEEYHRWLHKDFGIPPPDRARKDLGTPPGQHENPNARALDEHGSSETSGARNSGVDSDIDTALSNAKGGRITGGPRSGYKVEAGVGDKRRIPGGKIDKKMGNVKLPGRKLDIDDTRLSGESYKQATERAKVLITTTIADSPAVDAWKKALEHTSGKLDRPISHLDKPEMLKLYAATRDRFWIEVRNSPKSLDFLKNLGLEFKKNGAPLLIINDNAKAPDSHGRVITDQERRISLDHTAEKSIGDNWRLAVDPNNLTFLPQNANSHREIVQRRHKMK